MELDLLKKGAAAAFIEQVHEHFEAIDILVNNAWSGNKNTWESISEEDWDYDINMSLNSVFRLTKAAFEDLKRPAESSSILLRCTAISGPTTASTTARSLRIRRAMVRPRRAYFSSPSIWPAFFRRMAFASTR